MTVAEKIFALWSADAAAIAMVPAARFKYAGLYQGIDYPYVVFQPVIEQRYTTISEGATGALEYGNWQFSIHASGSTAASTADAIRRKIITVLDGHHAGGFNFFFRSSGPLIVSQDTAYVMLPVEFLVSGG